MECGQFVGKVKPETWWVNPWDFQKFATKGGAALGAADGIVNFGDSIWRWKPCFFFENFRGGICFVFFGMTKYGMKKFRLMVWNPPVFYILARVFTILSSKSPGIRNPSNVRIVQI